MRVPVYLGVLGALVVGGVLTIVLLAGSLGTAPLLPTRPPVSIPPLPTLTGIDSLPSAVPSGTPIAGSLAIGQAAPELRLTLTDGSLMDTADFAGLPLWVSFTATWCPQCTTELPMMERFQGQLKDQMTVLVVDVGEDRSTVRDFIKGLNVDLTVGLDPDGTIASQWGANALPIHYWIDADGVVQQIVYGGAAEQTFIEAITALVPEFSAGE
ncbi:MAG: TlpA disulfide reductase family protein [Candidatus Limnocylindrales bacterium]